MKKIRYSLVLPCFNEGPTFEASLKKIIDQVGGGLWEIIFVEDHSSDDTKKVVEKFAKHKKNAKIIIHKHNLGRGRSVRDGILASSGEICGYIDADCEISPSYIPIFIKEIEKGADLAIGKRFYEGGFKSISRVVASKAYAQMIKLFLDLPVDDTEAGYKFFKKSTILPVLKNTKNPHWFWDTEICARAYKAGLKISQVPVLFIRRPEKKSTVRLFADSVKYIDSLVKFRRDFKN